MSSTTQNNIQSDLKIQIQLNKEQLKLLENMPNMAYIFEKWSYNNEDCKFIYCSEASNNIYEIESNKIMEDPTSIIQ